jgi:predicted transposase/invertase (TIGR01784 family)
VEILNPIIEREFEEDKYAILDVRARDAFGNRFNIEIQRTLPTALRERLTYYAAAQLVEQLGAGDDYVALRPSIGICILDAVIFKRIDDLHLDFRLMNEKHRLMLTDHLQIHLLELPKYAPFEHNEVVSDPIEQWCYFFLRADELTAGEIVRNLRDAVFLEATEVLEMIARDPEQRSLYETRLKAERDARAKFEYAREEGHKEGHKEGEVVGEVRGKVKILRDLLHETFPTDTELQTYTLEQLAHVELSFQHRLRERG